MQRRVFISYSHSDGFALAIRLVGDLKEHGLIPWMDQEGLKAGLALANRLRQDGIDALVDQYNPAPPLGWPKWMEREIQAADFVLLVCTETCLRRVEGREQPGKGRGVLWESDLIYNLLYEQNLDVQRFVPILFAEGNIGRN